MNACFDTIRAGIEDTAGTYHYVDRTKTDCMLKLTMRILTEGSPIVSRDL